MSNVAGALVLPSFAPGPFRLGQKVLVEVIADTLGAAISGELLDPDLGGNIRQILVCRIVRRCGRQSVRCRRIKARHQSLKRIRQGIPIGVCRVGQAEELHLQPRRRDGDVGLSRREPAHVSPAVRRRDMGGGIEVVGPFRIVPGDLQGELVSGELRRQEPQAVFGHQPVHRSGSIG